MRPSAIHKLLLLVIVAISASGCAKPPSEDYAESVFINGEIYLGKVKNPWVSEVAVSDGRFVYVGDDSSAYVGPDTVIFDLDGRMTTPGFVDGHTHVGLVALSADLKEMAEPSSKTELMQNIRQLLLDNPGEDVIVGGYWPNGLFDENGPHKRDLDEIEASRPIILYDETTHSVWANSKALEEAGVTRDTPDIVPGFSFYKKDENGEPTGWITESAASVFLNHFHEVTPTVVDGMLEYMNYFRSVGVTTLLEAGSFGLDHEVHAAISSLDKEGRLPLRYHGSYTLFLPQDLPNAVSTLKGMSEEFNSENVKIDTLKLFFDGVIDTRTAAMSQDYLDTPGKSGEALLTRKQVHDLIIDLDLEGLNLHVHSVGDRGTTTILDAVEDVHATLDGPPSIRITICHLEIVKDEDFARFKPLGVIANFTPHWATGGDLSWYETGIGNLVYEMQRGQPLLSDGARVTFSSDNTTESEWKGERENSSPFTGMQVGHTRQDIGETEILPPVSERLQLDDLLNGYTTDAAYQLGRSDVGSIVVGQQADLVVLNQNLFEVDAHDIHRTKPVAVVMNGELVVGELQVVGD